MKMISLGQDSGYPGMNHLDGTMLTQGDPPPARYVHGSRPVSGSPILMSVTRPGAATASSDYECAANFGRDNLKRHLETYHDIAHRCEDCGSTYACADTLAKHVEKHQ
jgi:hypothetical protein